MDNTTASIFGLVLIVLLLLGFYVRFRFRDPLNQECHFIPQRLDGAPIKGSLAQFLHINWRPEDRDQAQRSSPLICN
ncbi:MAG: hypothetical protein WC740_07850 [Verrucomicrobiia bacterium]